MKNFTLLVAILCFPFLLVSQDGELDLSFNGDGRFTLDLNTTDQARAVALQPDEKIIITGRTGHSGNDDLLVLRLDRYGNPDLTFGIQGIVILDAGASSEEVRGVAVQPDGKILLAGRFNQGSGSKLVLSRLMPNGDIDYTFGDSGTVFRAIGNGSSFWNSVVVLPNGKVVVGGYTSFGGLKGILLGFEADGTINTNFGDSGVVELSLSGASVAFQKMKLAQGKIWVAGDAFLQGQRSMLLAKFNLDGTADATFGGNGVSTVPFDANTYAYDLAIQSDGKIILAGETSVDNRDQFALTRLLSNGNLDQNFGTNGKVTTPVLDDDAFANTVGVLGDGRILAGGQADGTWNKDFALVRYRTDGSLDPSFHFDGIVTKNMGNDNDYAMTGALQPNGRMLLVGYTLDNSTSSNTYDLAVARFLGGAASIGLEEWLDGQLAVYPNPASDFIRLQSEDEKLELDFTLMDALGREIKTAKLQNGSAEIPVADLSTGMYFIKMESFGFQSIFRKVLIR